MDEQKPFFSVCLMARLLKVSRSGYYKWRSRTETLTQKRRRIIKAAVFDTFHDKTFNKSYGAPRIMRELNDMGIKCSHNYVALLLHQLGLKARNGKKFRYSKASMANQNVSDNLLMRRFQAQRPNQKWSTDITYINANGKWIYLAVVMDLFSRAIVGWAVDRYMTIELITEALEMAFARRDIQDGLIVHSDRGVQFRSNRYRKILLDNSCRISMSRKADCWDNAAMESFFSRLKVELVYAERLNSISQAKTLLFEYIEIFYNRKRRHSAIGYVNPFKFEKMCA